MKLFSKMSKLFLCGVAVAMVGCADFSEDIQKVDDKLQNEVADLTEAVSALQVKLAEDYATKQSVESLKADLNGTIAAEVADLEKAIDNATAALNAAINEKADEADLKAVEKTVADLQADLAEAQEALQTKLAEAKAALEAADKANAKAIEDLTVRVAAAEKAIENINAAVATLQSDVEALKQAYMENTAALTNLKGSFDKFQEETTANVTALQGNLAALKAYVEEMNEDINARIDVVANALTAVNVLLEEEVDARQIADEEIYAAIDVVSQAVSAVNALLEDEAAEREAEDAAIYTALQETNTAISNVLVLLEDAKAELSEEFSAQIGVVSNAISSVYNQLNDLAIEVAAVSDRLSAQEAAFEAHKEVIDAKVAELKDQMTSLEPVIATLQAQSAELAATLESLSPVIENIEAKIAELAATFESLSPVIENIEAKIAELKNQMVSLEPVINNLNEQVTAMVALQERILSLAYIPATIDNDLNEVMDFYSVRRTAKNNAGIEFIASNKPTVAYRVNPTQANVEGVQWSFINREVAVRAAGDNTGLLTIVETKEPVNGELNFVVMATKDIKGTDNEGIKNGKADFVALQAQTEKYNIVSDFAALTDIDLNEYMIVNTVEDIEFFNVEWWYDYKKVKAENRPYYKDGVFYPVWSENALPVQLVHNESINLLEYVGTYCFELDDLLGAKYQIVPNYTFALVDEYLSPVDGVTDQQDFVVLEGDKVSVNLDFVKNVTEVAIGKTPVVEVISWYEGKEIAKAYIKIDIVEALKYKKEPVTYTVEPTKGYKYTELSCDKFDYTNAKSSASITWVDLTQNILADTGIKLPNEGFVEAYDFAAVTSKVYYTYGNVTVQDEDVKGVEIKTLPQDNTAATTTPVAAYALNCDINSANGTGRVEITIPSKDVYVYPDVTIIFNFTVSHETNLPKLYAKYAAENVVVVKGHEIEADGFAWSFEEVLHEAFDVATYKTYGCQNNHGPLSFRLAASSGRIAQITEGEWMDQVISLTNVSEIDWELYPNGINVNVELFTTLHNGEQCIFPYVVRFVNPFQIEIADVELETKLTATTADLLDYVTIYFDGTPVYAEHAYTEYGKELGLVGVLTSEYEVVDVPANIAKQEGWLDCTKAGIITWNNGGTTLLADEVAHSHARAHLEAIGYFGAKGNVTFLATK